MSARTLPAPALLRTDQRLSFANRGRDEYLHYKRGCGQRSGSPAVLSLPLNKHIRDNLRWLSGFALRR